MGGGGGGPSDQAPAPSPQPHEGSIVAVAGTAQPRQRGRPVWGAGGGQGGAREAWKGAGVPEDESALRVWKEVREHGSRIITGLEGGECFSPGRLYGESGPPSLERPTAGAPRPNRLRAAGPRCQPARRVALPLLFLPPALPAPGPGPSSCWPGALLIKSRKDLKPQAGLKG